MLSNTKKLLNERRFADALRLATAINVVITYMFRSDVRPHCDLVRIDGLEI